MRPQLPDYGVFTHWPGDGHQRIHPEDISQVVRLIPSARVFRREHFDDVFYHYTYGAIHFRIRPSMWLPVRYEGFDIGDQVEVSGLAMARQGMIGRIVEACFNRETMQIEYTILNADVIQPRVYHADELKQLTNKIQLRQGDMGHPPPQWDRRESDPGIDMDDSE